MSRNKFVIICFTVSVCVLMTGQKQILTELKSSWLVILTGDLPAVILSPGQKSYGWSQMLWVVPVPRAKWLPSTKNEPVTAEISPAPDWSIYLAIGSSQVPELPGLILSFLSFNFKYLWNLFLIWLTVNRK